MATDNGAYDRFVDESPQGCVFCKSWWLEAVAPGRHTILTVEKGGHIFAAWPMVFKKKLGLKVGCMPPLTQTLGIMFRPGSSKHSTELASQKSLVNELLEQLPSCFFHVQRFNYNFTNWLPLYWHRFKQTTKYTYVIEDLSDLEKVWARFDHNARLSVRKAARQGIRVEHDLGLDKFWDINRRTFQRQELEPPYSRGFLQRLDDACIRHNARRSFFALDDRDNVHAGVYIVWDQTSAYSLMLGTDPRYRSSQAASLAMWEAIRFAATVTKRFDFEGSMIEPVERFLRSFGGIQKPYISIARAANSLGRLYLCLKGW